MREREGISLPGCNYSLAGEGVGGKRNVKMSLAVKTCRILSLVLASLSLAPDTTLAFHTNLPACQ